MKYFWRILPYLRPHWRLAALSAGLTLLVTLLALAAPWPLKILFDNVLGRHPLPAWLVPILGGLSEERYALLVAVMVTKLGLTLAENTLIVVNSYMQTWLQQGMILNFRSDLFQHAQRLSLAYHDRKRAGGLIYAINYQADSAAGLAMALQPLAQSALTVIGMFVVVFTINREMALLSLLVVPFLYYSVGYYMTHIQQRLRKVKEMEGETLSIVHEAMSMLRVIVAFGRERYEHERFRTHGEQARDARVGVTVRQTLFSLVVNTTTAIGTALVMGFGAYQILNRQMTGGELLIVLTYLGSIYGPLQTMSTMIGSFQDRFISLEMAFKVLDAEPEIRDAPDAVAMKRAQGRIRFEGVHFRYQGRKDTLEDISFEAAPGELIGIVGPTGAGKTTLISLIPRFYNPTQGRVLLDEVDTRQIKLEDLRRQISLVLQEPLLFATSILDNIHYGRLEASREEIVDAAKAANAHDFIMRLPQQYDTKLGERGAQISGGERQRISIARAFLKDAPILILDEPTSSVDLRTEAVIFDALDRLMQGRTTFLITHRIASIRHADRILVMEAGRLVEQGSHEKLLRLGGLYTRFHEVQSGHARRQKPPLPAALADSIEVTP